MEAATKIGAMKRRHSNLIRMSLRQMRASEQIRRDERGERGGEHAEHDIDIARLPM